MEIPAPEAGTVKELRSRSATRSPRAARWSCWRSRPTRDAPARDDSTEPSGVRVVPRRWRPRLASAGDVHAGVLVLGSGPGGYAAAFRAADLGLDVVMVERYEPLGGVCLNVGCIPSKALLHVAKVIAEAETAGAHGVSFGKPEIDLDALRAWKDGVVAKLTGGVEQMAKGRKVQVVHGEARFTGPHMLAVLGADGETTTLSFDHAIVAAGSRSVQLAGHPARRPARHGLDRRAGARRHPRAPARRRRRDHRPGDGDRLRRAGLAGHRRRAGRRADPRRRPRPRQAAGQAHRRALRGDPPDDQGGQDRGRATTGCTPRSPATSTDAVFDRVLVAVGRMPNGAGLGLDTPACTSTSAASSPVDAQQRTNVAHIYAIGDVAGGPMLAHKATAEGHVAAEVIAGHASAFEPRGIPSVAYTDPEVAWVGLTETEAEEQAIAYEKSVFPWSASGRALAIDGADGLTKLLRDPETGRVLGAGIVGPDAGDLIAEPGFALEMGADVADLGLTIHAHPTLSETVMLAAEIADGTITDLPNKAAQRAAKARASPTCASPGPSASWTSAASRRSPTSTATRRRWRSSATCARCCGPRPRTTASA